MAKGAPGGPVDSPGVPPGQPEEGVPPSRGGGEHTGTFTFLFTDIEGSTRWLRDLGDAYGRLLEDHRGLLSGAVTEHQGEVVDCEGDGMFAAFARSSDAVAAALAAQRRLLSRAEIAPGQRLLVRMGLHTGEATRGAGGYVGLAVHHAARVGAAAHGGEVLVSEATAALLGEALSGGLTLRDLGLFELKDMARPEQLFRLCHPDLPAAFPAPRAPRPAAARLPLPPTVFVGRCAEVVRVRRLLVDERRRLVTLTGPGGVGKTRVAIEAARQIEPSFRDGAVFVALAELEDPALVTRRIAESIGAHDVGGRSPDLEALLRHRELLLVLDNLEHLLPAADSLGRLAAACPGVAVLATSREVLHLRGEAEVTVEPMHLPSPQVSDAREIAECDAVTLFVDRAREVKLDFEVTAENAAAVAAICRGLDGLPLALELAASRLKLFAPDVLLRRLGDHQERLVARARDLPARQRTLDATIGWSYELLSAPERSLLRQLAVFSGGFSLAAAESACEVPGLDLEDGLVALSDKSLLRVVDDIGGEPRFGLLGTIRDWVERHRDESGPPHRDEARARHAAWFLALAETAEPELASARRDRWVRRLRLEGDNMRAALRFALDHGEAARALRAMGGLAWAWYRLGLLSEGRSWLEQTLARSDSGADRPSRSRALTGAARLARYQDDFDAGRAWAEEAVLLARAGSNDRDLAFALNALGLNAQPLSDPIALEAATESVALMRRAGDEWGIALCVFYLGTFAFFLGGGDLVRRSLEESAELFRGLGDRWGLAGALFYLGWLEERESNRRRAQDLLEESVELLRLEDDKWRTAFALRRLADILDQPARAERLRAEAHALEETLGIGEAFTPSPTAGKS